MTGSTHANHRSARSPRPTPEGPARDNPIAGPQMGTNRSEPSAPASAGASGRHNEPGSRPASACPAQPPSKSGGESPRDVERHHGIRKADQSTGSDRTGRCAAHHAGPRGTPERHTAGHNHGTRTGARQQRPPGAANPDSARYDNTTTAEERHRRGDEAGQRQRDRTSRTGSSGSGQAAGTAAPRTGASRDQWRWTPPRTGTTGAEQAAGATGSHRSGHEDEAEEMQLSRLEDQAGEKRRKEDEEKAKVTQRCTQVDEEGGMRWSSQGHEAEEKQRSSDEEEPEEMQSRGDQDQAVHKQPRADEDK